jgi:hypothetical protein
MMGAIEQERDHQHDQDKQDTAAQRSHSRDGNHSEDQEQRQCQDNMLAWVTVGGHCRLILL